MNRAAVLWLCVAACSKSDPPRMKSEPLTTKSASPKPAGAGSDATSCAVDIVIDPTGASIATTAGSCRAPRIDGKLDIPWFEAELGALRWARPSCSSQALIVAETGPYQELIAIMDIALTKGFVDVNVGDKSELKFDMDGPTKLHCKLPSPPPEESTPKRANAWVQPPPTRPVTPKQVAELQEFKPLPPAPAPKDQLMHAPVIIVTKSEVTFHGKVITSVDAVRRDPGALKPLGDVLRAAAEAIERDRAAGRLPPELMKACEDADRAIRSEPGTICPVGVAILQADETTDMRVINAILHTARGAGFDNVLFAVKNKQMP